MDTEFGMLAHHWNGSLEQVQGWFASRKYNGWSALWDGGITKGMLASEVPWYHRGADKQIYYSTGLWTLGRNNGLVGDRMIKPKPINAPKYFTDMLPKNVPVHGELWYEDKLSTIKRCCGQRLGYNSMWYNIMFMAYGIKPLNLWEGIKEVPRYKNLHLNIPWLITHEGVSFKKSMDYLSLFKNDTFYPVHRWTIETEDQIKSLQRLAISYGWEGIMFHNPEGMYECKRSWNNLKWKQEYETEAAVYDYEKGKTGRMIGKVGALWATLIWDEKVASTFGGDESMIGQEVSFKISGLTDKEREWVTCRTSYPIGKAVKFKYSGVSGHGVPQSCNVYRGT